MRRRADLARAKPQQMLAVADRFEADLPVAEVDVTSTADLTRLLEPSKSWTLTRKSDN